MHRCTGCEDVRVEETKCNPIVYGECKVDSDRTLLVCFMYNTMPYNEPGWRSPPMGARTVGMSLPSGRVGALVNRCADNTKWSLAALLNAVATAAKSVSRPPINLLLVAEGEEGLRSSNLPAFVGKGEESAGTRGRVVLPLPFAARERCSNHLRGSQGCYPLRARVLGETVERGTSGLCHTQR